jgi:hypothetical protein
MCVFFSANLLKIYYNCNYLDIYAIKQTPIKNLT